MSRFTVLSEQVRRTTAPVTFNRLCKKLQYTDGAATRAPETAATAARARVCVCVCVSVCACAARPQVLDTQVQEAVANSSRWITAAAWPCR